jgi:hypothetical protein
VRNAQTIEAAAHRGNALLVPRALDLAGFQVPDAGRGTGSERRGRAVVKMKPLAKVRTKSHRLSDAAI